MLIANGTPVRLGFGAIDYTCEGGVCTGDTAWQRSIFAKLQQTINRFLGYGLIKTIAVDGVLGPETSNALYGLAVALTAVGQAGSFLRRAVQFGEADPAWIATWASSITQELTSAAEALKRPIAIAPTIVTAPPKSPADAAAAQIVTAALTPKAAPRWPWIVGGVAALGLGVTVVALALRKKKGRRY